MFFSNNKILLSKFLKINNKEDFSLDDDSIDIENKFTKNFISKENELNLINNDDVHTIFSSIFSLSTIAPLNESNNGKIINNLLAQNSKISNENEDISLKNLENKEKKRIFGIVYKKKETLFTLEENDSLIKKENEYILKRKRMPFRRQRKDNVDNIRRKIKRGFFNVSLIYKLNEKLKNIGSNKYFEKFPPHFVSDIDKKRNKEIFKMTLSELFQNK